MNTDYVPIGIYLSSVSLSRDDESLLGIWKSQSLQTIGDNVVDNINSNLNIIDEKANELYKEIRQNAINFGETLISFYANAIEGLVEEQQKHIDSEEERQKELEHLNRQYVKVKLDISLLITQLTFIHNPVNLPFWKDFFIRASKPLIKLNIFRNLKSNLLINHGNKIGVLGDRQQEALACFEQAIQLTPWNENAWSYRGAILEDLQRYQDAVDSYDLAIKFGSNDSIVSWWGRGNALVKLKHYQKAIDSFNKAIELKHTFTEKWPDIWLDKGNALVGLQRYSEALDSFDKAMQIDPDRAETWYNKACCYAQQNNIEHTIETLRKALDIQPYVYRELAQKNTVFDKLRQNSEFQEMLLDES